MNKACVKCGKIMLVPDIPLPRNYTQKCTSCHHMNRVGEDLYYEEHPGERPEDSIDLVDFDDRYVDPLDLSRGSISQDNAEEWMEKIKSHPLPMEDHESPPATLEEPFVPPAPEVEDSFSTEMPPPPGPDPVALDVVQQVRREFAEVLESLKKERNDLQDMVEEKLQELVLEIEKLRASEPKGKQESAPETKPEGDYSKALVAKGEVLLCSQDSKLIAACEEALNGVGLLVNAATSHEIAGRRIQEYAYQIIVFDQKFVVGSKEGQAVLNSVRKIALPVRRHQSVVMLTPGIPSCESQVFYQWGIDLNVHTDDLTELGGYVIDLVQLKSGLLSAYLDSDLDTDRTMA